MSDHSSDKPEIPPAPGSARAARGGRISGRVLLVLSVSMVFAVLMMVVAWYAW